MARGQMRIKKRPFTSPKGKKGSILQAKLNSMAEGNNYTPSMGKDCPLVRSGNILKQIMERDALKAQSQQEQGTGTSQLSHKQSSRTPLYPNVIQSLTSGVVQRTDREKPVNLYPTGKGRSLPDEIVDNFTGQGHPEVEEAEVHVDDAAAQSIGAQAYTTGKKHIVVQSRVANDKKVLTHEATHVAQQHNMDVEPTIPNTPINDTLEKDAQENEQRITQNQPVSVQLKGGASIQRSTNLIQRSPETIWGTHEDALTQVIKSPGKVRQVLKKDFYSNWFIAKDYLVANKWQNKSKRSISEKKPRFEKLMRALLAVREYDTNKLLRHIRDTKLPAQYPHMRKMDPAKRLSWAAAGSTTLTSDIDVNLKGAGSIAAVGLFNKLFKTQEKWAYDAGTVYDVNVYAQDFMTPGQTKTLSGGHKKLGSPFEKQEQDNQVTLTPVEEVSPLTDEDSIAFETFSANQDVWSMAKMRMYMTDNEWNAYKADMLGTEMNEQMMANDPDSYQKKEQLKQQLLDAEYYYEDYLESIEHEVNIINTNANHVYDRLHETLDQGGNTVSEHHKEETKKMIAANLIYERKLNRVQTLRNQLQTLKQQRPRTQEVIKDMKECGINLKNALSEAIMFSNEAYFSQGAVQDVVLGYQIGQGMAKKTGKTVDLQLANQLRLQSMREQVGDTLKVLKEYANQPAWKGVYKAGKYIDRMILAATSLLPNGLSNNLTQDFTFIRNLGQKATQLKGQGADQTTQRVELKNLMGQSSLADIRRIIIRIGTIVDQHANQVW
ncbi:MAG: DUF4157 domain-containing protein [Roseofilum sp. SBFL]|uniref:eCIS core domain-containing protein n=1 Tax=unclassified Roseofilum TaxID=2620099 RepID=UPI001B1F50E4|nr:MULTISPECIES: DUF4157 domain-containing protein [unclassified Roseofilum]MBP0012946.1 DUF4157 domain-containing protein [Roseofilum sp. SID3]MBP0022786.1 DUF4157 domain-containing protein [Roseofilum sp. SID2]MBP0038852.1 DUF4157 domain-containing protein [Roseofilum sp. SID1]MBP0043917.1 DUF4157 domain-containing protein [Roseofilum sp. SBFL]